MVTANVTRCSLGTTYVDAQVSCVSRGSLGKASCAVNAVRKMLNPPTPSDFSILDPEVPYTCTPGSAVCDWLQNGMAHPLDETVDLFHAAFSTWLDSLAIKGLPEMILR
jgi:hypothetical protein